MNHAQTTKAFFKDPQRVGWHDNALWYVRSKRDKAANQVKDWEYLKDAGAAIKQHTLAHLDKYLQNFEDNAQQNGVHVHWATDAQEHNQIVHRILAQKGVTRIVKSKSMLTEECGLNPYLESNGIEVIDTDLGERIVQLAKESPSHIVMPAIHKKKEEIDTLFQEHLHTAPCGGDPLYLTREARKHLREKFLNAEAAITGVNFAIADNGAIVVCTNEGNADMGVQLTDLHIACMGIEKVIPSMEDLGVFIRLLARSATGQPITTYTSHFIRPKPNATMHIVIVDNGRTRQMARSDFKNSLHCIRCGACMNTCPIYRRSGGHSYDATIPGPIGSILSPGIDLKKYSSLPFASTLCGSCTEVCPVRINIHDQLYKWRQIISVDGNFPIGKKVSMKITGYILARPRL